MVQVGLRLLIRLGARYDRSILHFGQSAFVCQRYSRLARRYYDIACLPNQRQHLSFLWNHFSSATLDYAIKMLCLIVCDGGTESLWLKFKNFLPVCYLLR